MSTGGDRRPGRLAAGHLARGCGLHPRHAGRGGAARGGDRAAVRHQGGERVQPGAVRAGGHGAVPGVPADEQLLLLQHHVHHPPAHQGDGDTWLSGTRYIWTYLHSICIVSTQLTVSTILQNSMYTVSIIYLYPIYSVSASIYTVSTQHSICSSTQYLHHIYKVQGVFFSLDSVRGL